MSSWRKLKTFHLKLGGCIPLPVCHFHLPFTRPSIQFHFHSQSALAATQLAMPQSLWFSRLMKISFGIKAKFFFSSLLPFHLQSPSPSSSSAVYVYNLVATKSQRFIWSHQTILWSGLMLTTKLFHLIAAEIFNIN